MRAEAMSTVVTLVLQAVTLMVAVWATWTARRSLKVAVSPQIECFLRQQQASPLVDFVIQNTGVGNAYNVGWKIEADEHDFKSHVGAIGPPLEKAVPFSVVEAGGGSNNLLWCSSAPNEYSRRGWRSDEAICGYGYFRMDASLDQ